MRNHLTKARAIIALGLPSIARAVIYRLGVKLGLNSVRRIKGDVAQGPFFFHVDAAAIEASGIDRWHHSGHLFSRWMIEVGTQPLNWLANPLTGQSQFDATKPWWKIPDFDVNTGDIKIVWELSRMDWVLALAQSARQGEKHSLQKLNHWLSDWCIKNPPYLGPNWKCGQEASIRVMHLAMAALILEQTGNPAQGLRDLIQIHLKRIAPTVQYAMAQDNNHGTSEAVALFIGGSWLASLGVVNGSDWAITGRRLLENRANRLIGEQGSFSQYSLNYHRLMLDTICVAEVWRRSLQLQDFSTPFMTRMRAATEWLRHMINPINGDGPNVGANDGARLLQLTNSGYRDHRPTVQLAMALFFNQRAYGPGTWDNALHWLGIKVPKITVNKPVDYIADDGGFALLRRGRSMVMLRYPRFRFRPSQADALHLDFWLDGLNLLRDAGTFSYNADVGSMNYFGGTASHNTVQFDDRDQMPRVSRFLLGNWLKTDFRKSLVKSDTATNFGASYTDSKGARHYRQVILQDKNLKVVDNVSGAFKKAILRWRFMPGTWQLEVTSPTSIRVTCDGESSITMTVTSSVPFAFARIVEGWESRHYLEKTSLSVLELEIQQSSTMTSELHFST